MANEYSININLQEKVFLQTLFFNSGPPSIGINAVDQMVNAKKLQGLIMCVDDRIVWNNGLNQT